MTMPIGNTPGYGADRDAVSGERPEGAFSGVAIPGLDPTFQKGNYGDSIFGVALPQGTGAPGSQGAQYDSSVDPTTQPGQLDEGFSGLGPQDTADTGSPGSSPVGDRPAGTTVEFTAPGSYLTGTYQSMTVPGQLDGTGDWTQASPNLYSGATNLPGIPEAAAGLADTGAGKGSVMRGGNAVGG